jgi:hypothetical protein
VEELYRVKGIMAEGVGQSETRNRGKRPGQQGIFEQDTEKGLGRD